MKFKTIILFIMFHYFVYSQSSSGQPIPSKQINWAKIKENIFFGGNFGAWFGANTYVNISPLVGYKISPKLSAGGGITYNYFSQRYASGKYVSTIYGVNTFARYFILDNIFLQVGWDRLSVPYWGSYNKERRIWVDNVLVGGGLRQELSPKVMMLAAVFYNLNETPLSPYPNPIIQIGIIGGF